MNRKNFLQLLSLALIIVILPIGVMMALTRQELRQQAATPQEGATLTLSPASAVFVPRQVGRIEVLLDTQFQQVNKVQMGVDITGAVPSDLKFAPTQPSGWLVTTNTMHSTQAGLRLTVVMEPNPNQEAATFATTGVASSVGTFSFTGSNSQSMNFIFDRDFTQVWQAQTGENIVVPPIDYQYEFNPNSATNPGSLSLVKASAEVPSRKSTFQVDLRANTGGQQISQVQGLITFDPRILRVRELQKNETVFPDYSQFSFDNQNGLISVQALTRASEPGVAGENMLVARVLFEALVESGRTEIALKFDPQQDRGTSKMTLASGSMTGASTGRDILGRVSNVTTAIDPEVSSVITFQNQRLGVWEVVGLGFLGMLALLGIGMVVGNLRKNEYQHLGNRKRY